LVLMCEDCIPRGLQARGCVKLLVAGGRKPKTGKRENNVCLSPRRVIGTLVYGMLQAGRGSVFVLMCDDWIPGFSGCVCCLWLVDENRKTGKLAS